MIETHSRNTRDQRNGLTDSYFPNNAVRHLAGCSFSLLLVSLLVTWCWMACDVSNVLAALLWCSFAVDKEIHVWDAVCGIRLGMLESNGA